MCTSTTQSALWNFKASLFQSRPTGADRYFHRSASMWFHFPGNKNVMNSFSYYSSTIS